MENTRTRLGPAAALLALALLGAACGNDGGGNATATTGGTTTTPPAGTDFNEPHLEGVPAQGGTIKFGSPAQVASLDPAGNLAQPSDLDLALAIYDQLVTYGADGELAPMLATSWTNSDDMLTWTFELREGVVFQDGTPFDAAAVKAHFDRMADPATKCGCDDFTGQIEQVSVADPLTVTFELGEPNAFFANALAGAAGLIPSPTATAKWGADYPRHPVGTGPFALADFDELLLERNPDYWRRDDQGRQLPYLDSIDVQVIEDSKVRFQSVQEGDVDIVYTADTATVVDAVSDQDLSVQKVAGSSSTITIFNTRKLPFDDVRMRRAVAYAFDRQELNRLGYQGTRQEAYSLLSPSSPFYVETDFPHLDRAAAKDLVDELRADGVSLEYTEKCIDTSESHLGLEVAQRNERKVGLDPDVEFLDQGAYVNQILGADPEFEVGCFKGPQVTTADGLYNALHSGDSITGWHNAKVDAALEAIRGTTDPAEHARQLKIVQEEFAKDVPIVPTLYDLAANIHRTDVSGLPAPEPNFLGVIKFATLYRLEGD